MVACHGRQQVIRTPAGDRLPDAKSFVCVAIGRMKKICWSNGQASAIAANLLVCSGHQPEKFRMWMQRILRLPPADRGVHLITREVVEAVPELTKIRVGWMQVFMQHTSASLTINENADPDVRIDFEMVLNHVVPESLPYVHTIEGPDDMPAHVKASMMGASVMIPIGEGRLLLGTWQGIYLCEHRDRAGGRNVVITIQGDW